MVGINSGSHNKTGVDAVGRVVTDALAGCGLTVEVIEEERVGNQLVVRSPCPSTDTGRVLLVGHMDTVFAADTEFTDYRENDTRAYGPGVTPTNTCSNPACPNAPCCWPVSSPIFQAHKSARITRGKIVLTTRESLR